MRTYAKAEGFTDEGERAALEAIRDEVRDRPILDLGVGAGRTLPILQDVSRDYVGLDYTEELVVACRNKYPGASVVLGDARDLSRFEAGRFKLVVFSFCGLDGVGHADRAKVLREVHRVLARDGVFFFSAHNEDGPSHEEGLTLGFSWTGNPLKLASRSFRVLLRARETFRNYEKFRLLRTEGDGFSVHNSGAHRHGILMHFITLQEQRRELGAEGFEPNAPAFSNVDGALVDGDTKKASWFHFLARKRA